MIAKLMSAKAHRIRFLLPLVHMDNAFSVEGTEPDNRNFSYQRFGSSVLVSMVLHHGFRAVHRLWPTIQPSIDNYF